MPRIIAALAIAAALIISVFVIKGKENPVSTKAAVIAEQIQSENAPALEAYAQELQASSTITSLGTNDFSYPTTSTPMTPPTATDLLAQNIMEQYVNLKQSGVDISGDISNQIADTVLSQSYSGSDAPKTYSEKDFTLQYANSETEMNNYSPAFSAAISVPLPQDGRNELEVFEDFANSNNSSILSALSININRYEKIISKLLSMPVPEVFIDDHVDLTNNLSEMVFDIQKMQNFPTDPVGGLNAVSDYDTASKNMAATLSDEITLFSKENIKFSAGN